MIIHREVPAARVKAGAGEAKIPKVGNSRETDCNTDTCLLKFRYRVQC